MAQGSGLAGPHSWLPGSSAEPGIPLRKSGPDARPSATVMTTVLVLCTANQCRSVMAQALLTRRLAAAGAAAAVRSAGIAGGGGPPPPEVISALAAYGLDVRAHRGRSLAEGDLASSDLVLAMAREHLRRAVVTAPGAWPRAFTLKELVRSGEEAGPGPARPGKLSAAGRRPARGHRRPARRPAAGLCRYRRRAGPSAGTACGACLGIGRILASAACPAAGAPAP